ncbi:MAG: sigma-54 dependent transcriptional regulator [Candidatus Eisenbacteria bacterium]
MRCSSKNRRLREELSEVRGRRDLIAVSETMRRTLDVVQQVAQSSATTLIVGESGTGKEVIANLIHTSSERRDGPFIKVSCAAIPETLLEAELFGHEKGAFTGAVHQRKGRFELAHMGTLFLDEVGEMSPTIQVKLLRVLQEGEFERLGGNQTLRSDVRLITATNVDLEDAVRHGRFRSDLYYRLNVITVPLPPLRERREDIPLLASYFCRRLAAKHGKAIQGVSAAAMERLLQYAWPGNVRELENVVERAVVLGRGTLLAEEDLPPAIHAAVTPSPEIRIPVGMPMREAEDRIIRATLQHTGGNKEQAARLLGIASRTIHRKVGPRNASK